MGHRLFSRGCAYLCVLPSAAGLPVLLRHPTNTEGWVPTFVARGDELSDLMEIPLPSTPPLAHAPNIGSPSAIVFSFLPPNGNETLELTVIGLRPKTLVTNAKRSSLIWRSVWQNWRERIDDYEQARTSLKSPPPEKKHDGQPAVIKALQASGLPLNIQVPLSASSHSLPTSTSPAGSLPTIVPSPPTAYPLSPATSASSLPSSNIFGEFESTRNLAQVATVESGPQLIPTSLQRVDSRRTIISPNLTSLHLSRRRLPQTTQSRNRSATALWRSSFRRSLPPHLHQLCLSPSKFSPRMFELLPESRRHPSSRRRCTLLLACCANKYSGS